MDTPAISVAMPCVNAAATLPLAIRSVLGQSFQDWEFLIFDDGSRDGTGEIARAFADPRIRVTASSRRQGLGAGLNECIGRARGMYLARMDSDDVSYPRRLEKQVAFLDANPDVDLVGAQAVVFGARGSPIGKRRTPLAHAEIACRPARGFGMIHPTWIGKTAWFRKYRYRAEATRCEDHDMLYRSCRESVFANLPEILLGYREEKVELGKLLRSRWGWIKQLWSYRSGMADSVGVGKEGVVAGLKASLDGLAVLTGLQHRLLKHRALPLTGAEIEEWRNVWHSVQ